MLFTGFGIVKCVDKVFVMLLSFIIRCIRIGVIDKFTVQQCLCWNQYGGSIAIIIFLEIFASVMMEYVRRCVSCVEKILFNSAIVSSKILSGLQGCDVSSSLGGTKQNGRQIL
jgi:hypothetical protein